MIHAGALSDHTRRGELFEALDGNRIRCLACGHRCPIPAGYAGACRVRLNRKGTLRVPYGYVNTIQCDPIEKKPFFHALPGSTTLSFGMLGCCFHCEYCQNWLSSQALRDIRSTTKLQEISPEKIVELAIAAKASALISTYNEPLITAEWASAVFRQAKAAGLVTGFVSNGNATPEVLEYLRPWVDLFKVDLKTIDDSRYHQLGGRLKPVVDSIAAIHEMGFWLEVVTLVVPGFNDSIRELDALTRSLAGISQDIPWHVTAFHPAYRLTQSEDTTAETLVRAASIARNAGLRYVYAGNLPGQVGDLENTRCASCNDLLIQRCGFRVVRNRITIEGCCPGCGLRIPGIWRTGRGKVKSHDLLVYARCG